MSTCVASADGYENASASTTFEVIGSGDFLFDNSTSDEFDDFSDGSSSSDDCCSLLMITTMTLTLLQ